MGELKPKLLKWFMEWNCYEENVGVLPGINVDEMVDESCSQTSPPMRLPDEDWVNDVQRVALKTSSSRYWPSFTLQSAEADWCSLHPAQQHLRTVRAWNSGTSHHQTLLYSRCPLSQVKRSLSGSGHSLAARSDSKQCCSAQTAAISPAPSPQLSNHWTHPGLALWLPCSGECLRWPPSLYCWTELQDNTGRSCRSNPSASAGLCHLCHQVLCWRLAALTTQHTSYVGQLRLGWLPQDQTLPSLEGNPDDSLYTAEHPSLSLSLDKSCGGSIIMEYYLIYLT